MSGDAMQLEGTVIAERRGGLFEVEAHVGSFRRTVLARVSGRLHTRRIRCVVGDVVTVEVSAYDPTRGRIVYRGPARPPPEAA